VQTRPKAVGNSEFGVARTASLETSHAKETQAEKKGDTSATLLRIDREEKGTPEW